MKEVSAKIKKLGMSVSVLGMVFLFNSSGLSWTNDWWEITGYIGWEFLDMDREVLFDTEGFEPYSFVIKQKEYIENKSRTAKEVKEYFQNLYTPLVVKICLKKELGEYGYLAIKEISCKSDSHIYQANKLGRWEYEFGNVPKSVGGYAFLNLPVEIEYTFFYLLPKDSLLDKVFIGISGYYGSLEAPPVVSKIVVNRQQKKSGVEEYIKQLQAKVEKINKKINELREHLEKEE